MLCGMVLGIGYMEYGPIPGNGVVVQIGGVYPGPSDREAVVIRRSMRGLLSQPTDALVLRGRTAHDDLDLEALVPYVQWGMFTIEHVSWLGDNRIRLEVRSVRSRSAIHRLEITFQDGTFIMLVAG